MFPVTTFKLKMNTFSNIFKAPPVHQFIFQICQKYWQQKKDSYHSNICKKFDRCTCFWLSQKCIITVLGQLCDNDCTILLNKYSLHVFKNLHHILQGVRNKTDGPWDILLLPQDYTKPTQYMNMLINNTTTKEDLIHFFHGACFSPTKSTLLKAIQKGNFLT